MPVKKRPRRGSIQFWPRKRAKRFYPSVRWKPLEHEKAKALGFAAYKVGMAQVQYQKDNKTVSIPVTVLEAPPLFVCGLRFYSSSGVIGEMWAEKLPKGIERKLGKRTAKNKFDYEKRKEEVRDVRLIVSAQPEKSGMRKIKPEVFEIGIGGTVEGKMEYAKSMLGKELAASDVFRPGEFCDATSITKGHGFTGSVKRFGIRIQGRKDEQHHRHTGSVGSTTPRKIDWRVPLPGQHGFHQRTEYNKKIVMIDSGEKKLNPKSGWKGYGLIKGGQMLISGSVPGPRKRLVLITVPRRTEKFEPIEIRKVVLK